MKLIKTLAASAVASFAISSAANADMILWSDMSVTGLSGKGYEVDADRQHTATFEYVAGTTWGDVFVFYDATSYDSKTQDNIGFYGEISPRISMKKTFGAELGGDVLADVLLAFTLENGRGDVETFLSGVGFDWNVPGFNFVQTNVYYRSGINTDSDGFQLTPVWNMDFKVGNSKIVFDGFADWVFNTSDDQYATNLHINPQLKYDLGMALNGESGANKLYVGVELDYWKNKYGIEDSKFFTTNQTAASLLVKYHF